MKINAQAGSQQLDVSIERENGHYVVEVDGTRYLVDAIPLDGNFFSILNGERSYEVSVEAKRDSYVVRHGASEQIVTLTDAGRRARAAMGSASGVQEVTAAMPGKVVRLLVAVGDEVTSGQGLCVLEAMKMENEIASPKDGTVKSIAVSDGETVEGGATLLTVE